METTTINVEKIEKGVKRIELVFGIISVAFILFAVGIGVLDAEEGLPDIGVL